MQSAFVPAPHTLFFKLHIPRWSHIPADYTLGRNVEAKGLRRKIVLSQHAPPPQCDSLPRRSSMVGTGLDEPGESCAEIQSTEKEDIFPLQAGRNGGTSPEQEWTLNLLQADVGVKPEISTSEQAAARKDFARSSKKRQQQRMTAWGNDQTKQLDPGG